VEQGEGANHVQVWDGDSDVFHPQRDQVAHYYRFQELKLGRRYRRGDSPRSVPTGDPISIDWEAVRPMRTNPRTSDHLPDGPIRLAQEDFNHSYCGLLQLLEQAFNGRPAEARGNDRNNVHLESAGPSTDANADRRWSCDGRTNF
jgi:hypothetical protein